ncbi:MAG TPA: hypothetical protein VJV40_02515 [Thermodesulfobacteriota bacterium]|nr:hypothetical protein [Thermodesulfobacteriota bacterium]
MTVPSSYVTGSRGRRVSKEFKVCKVTQGRKVLKACREIPDLRDRREYKVMQDPQGRRECRVIRDLRAIPVRTDLRVF